MNIIRIIPVLLLSAVIVIGCQQKNVKEEIERIESLLKENQDEKLNLELANLYITYADENPKEDSLRENYLLKAADIYFKSDDYSRSAEILRKMVQDYFPLNSTDQAIIALANLQFQNFIDTEREGVELKNFKACFSDQVALQDKLNTLIDAEASRSTDVNSLQLNTTASFNFMNLSQLYGNLFKDSNNGGARLLEAAKMAVFFKKYERALSIYQELVVSFKGKEEGAKACFMSAFTLDNHLGKLEEARDGYNQFINDYPEHPLVESARFLLENLGKSEEEIISSFRK